MSARAIGAVVAGFLSGVFLTSIYIVGLSIVWSVLVLAATALALALFGRSKARICVGAAVALLACAAGILRMQYAVIPFESNLANRVGEKVVLMGEVVSEPDMRESNARIHIETRALVVGSTMIPIHAGVLVVAPAHTDIAYGDVVRAEGQLELPKPFDTNEGRQFNYPMYLAKDGVSYILSFAEIESTRENRGNILQAAAIQAKQKFLQGMQAVLPEPEAGLAGGITVGDKRSIGKDLTNTFIAVSLIHVVVLSGYNITILINFVRRILQFAPRILQYCGIASSVLFMVLMTGGAPSATRAAAMSLIAVFARATARTFIALRILGVVSVVMVAWNPYYLVFDPGFQLSILATLGLILLTSPIAERIGWVTERFGLREIVASTLSTQLMVLPLLLYQNGLFSIVSLPANLLALVVVPYAMFASIIAAVAGMVMSSYAIPIAVPALVLLSYIIGIASFFASLPFASRSIPAFSAWWLVPAYGFVFGLFWYMQRKSARGEGRKRFF